MASSAWCELEETDEGVADASTLAVSSWSAVFDDTEEALEAEDSVQDSTGAASAFLVLGVAVNGFFVVGAVFLSLDPVDKVSFLVLVLPELAEDESPEAVARVPDVAVVPVVRLTVVPSAYKQDSQIINK